MKNFYDVLGVAKDASEQDIKAAFRKLSLKYHPDRNPDDKIAEDKFKEINEAYQTLGEPEKRQMYDLGGSNQHSGFDPNQQINEILRNMGFNINIDMSGGNPFGGRGGQHGKMQVRQQVNISLRDAVFGCDVGINVPSYPNCKDCNGVGGVKATCHKCAGVGQTVTFLGTMQFPALCVTCNGKGYVLTSTCQSCNQEGFKKKTKHLKLKIPAGIQHQSTLHVGADADDRCDVFIIINVAKHPKISRNGATLFSTEMISCLDAMIGGIKKVETIDGVCDLEIPAGTQHGQQLVIPDHGGILTNGRANHVVSVHIDIPKNLTPEQIKKVQELKNS
jgi:molecular chaperone DnaJ